mgnify:CR=1 FL=1|tara:strand:+ start:452 stop:832 length:381 start_codon:yes stop_codon:yes gene_type:complete
MKTITLITRKETSSDFQQEFGKDEIELMIRRNKSVNIPNGWELTEEMFNKMNNNHVSCGEDWVESSYWDEDDDEMFGELDDYQEDILDMVGFRKRKVKNPKYDPKKESGIFNPKTSIEWYLPSEVQ